MLRSRVVRLSLEYPEELGGGCGSGGTHTNDLSCNVARSRAHQSINLSINPSINQYTLAAPLVLEMELLNPNPRVYEIEDDDAFKRSRAERGLSALAFAALDEGDAVEPVDAFEVFDILYQVAWLS